MEASIYPLGIIAPRRENHVDYESDPAVDRLWSLYEGRVSNINLKNFFFEVIDTFKSLIGENSNFGEFVETNLRSANLTPSMQEFLMDTVRYIYDGKRQMHVSTWDYLLRTHHDVKDQPQTGIHSTRHRNPKTDILGHPVVGDTQWIGEWLKHPDGFADMVWTMRILFGTVSQAR